MNLSHWILFIGFVCTPIGLLIKLDLACKKDEAHVTTAQEEDHKKAKEADKYPPGERDTQMRNAIKVHNANQVRRLLEGHDLTLAKSKQDKAYQRFTKGLYGGWDWELCKQLAPRFTVSLLWTLFVNPFYFLSMHSALQFFKAPFNLVWNGLAFFYYLMTCISLITKVKAAFREKFKEAISKYWPWFTFLNVVYMCYRIYRDVKAPSYLMMILSSDKFTKEEKSTLQEKFYAKITAGKDTKNKPPTMETYGVICEQHKAVESIEELLKSFEDSLKTINEENKPRGHAWVMHIFFPRTVFSALRTGLFYSDLDFTYVALPPSSDASHKISTHKDGIQLKRDDFLTKDEEGNPKDIDFPKIMWTVGHLIWAVCLHSGLPSEYQLPTPKGVN